MIKQFNTAMIKSSLYQYTGADVNNGNIKKYLNIVLQSLAAKAKWAIPKYLKQNV